MCTVTFFPNDEKNWILSTNRDEMKSRERARLPALHKSGNLNYLAPVDGKAGGTWIGLNQAGICLTVLNNYQGNNPLLAHRSDAVSRGLIIPYLMNLDHLNDVNTKMRGLNVSRYNPFRLIGIQSNPWLIREWNWDGQIFAGRSLPEKPHLWVSSGKDYKEVFEVRNSLFQKFLMAHPKPGVEEVKRLHASTCPEPGAYAIAMEQDRVATVSNTIAEVSNGTLKMHYHDGKPVEAGEWTTFSYRISY